MWRKAKQCHSSYPARLTLCYDWSIRFPLQGLTTRLVPTTSVLCSLFTTLRIKSTLPSCVSREWRMYRLVLTLPVRLGEHQWRGLFRLDLPGVRQYLHHPIGRPRPTIICRRLDSTRLDSTYNGLVYDRLSHKIRTHVVVWQIRM
jgi:hypothetical protein